MCSYCFLLLGIPWRASVRLACLLIKGHLGHFHLELTTVTNTASVTLRRDNVLRIIEFKILKHHILFYLHMGVLLACVSASGTKTKKRHQI